MNIRKPLGIAAGILLLLAFTSSGWIYNVVRKSAQLEASNEQMALRATFLQQYGNQAIIKQLVSPKKVYSVFWTDEAGINHVSWNIGGLWVMVYSSNDAAPEK